MARDMGRGIIAPDNNDNIGTGASEMRTLGATTAAAITDVDRRATARIGTLETVTGAHSKELTEVMRRTSENRLDLKRLETEGIEGLKGDPGEPGPGGSIALEETDPGCFVDSEITWMQWPESGGLPAVWNPNTQTHEQPIRVDTSVGTRVYVGDTMIYGDTGWRELPLPERFISGRVLIRRKNDVVNIRFEGVEITEVHPDNHPQEYITAVGYIPIGFRPQRYNDRHSAVVNGSYASHSTTMGVGQQSRLMLFHRIGSLNIGIGTARASGELSFTTNSTWPTSLPYVPA